MFSYTYMNIHYITPSCACNVLLYIFKYTLYNTKCSLIHTQTYTIQQQAVHAIFSYTYTNIYNSVHTMFSYTYSNMHYTTASRGCNVLLYIHKHTLYTTKCSLIHTQTCTIQQQAVDAMFSCTIELNFY